MFLWRSKKTIVTFWLEKKKKKTSYVELQDTIFTLSIWIESPEQIVQTQITYHRMWHLIWVYTVCHSPSSFLTNLQVVKWKFSTVILSFRLIQEGQLSVSSKRLCTILVNRLED